MSSNYLVTKYKGKYRLLPELDTYTHDFPRLHDGSIDPDIEIYIACRNGCKISFWGLNESRRGVLIAYIPSIGRGRNIKKELLKQKIAILDYDESDEEVRFLFNASDIEPVAETMKAMTSGANISPFSSKNLPKNNDVAIPDEDIARYKYIVSKLDKGDMLFIKNANNEFMNEVLAKRLRPKGKRKPFDYSRDMRQMQLGRQLKEYIFVKGMFDDYLEFLNKKIEEFNENK